jgi:hypothetical protein
MELSHVTGVHAKCCKKALTLKFRVLSIQFTSDAFASIREMSFKPMWSFSNHANLL